MDNDRLKKSPVIATTIFLCVELVFFALIMFGPGNLTGIFEFSSIAIVFCFSLLFFAKLPIIILTEVALFFTMTADFFLEIVTPMMQAVAMTSFLMVQLCYFARLFLELKTKKWRIINLAIRAAAILIATVITILVLKDHFDYLSCVSIIYFVNLLLNIALAFAEFKVAPLFAFGLLLFLGCDVFIGLQAAAGVYLDIPTTSLLYQIIFMPFNIAWFCYLPSQVLIATSLVKIKCNNATVLIEN